MKELAKLNLNDIKPTELGGNGLSGNGIDCNLEQFDFDKYLKELEF